MAEIKTCEQYVLSRLEQLEKENDNLMENLDNLRCDYDTLLEAHEKLINIICRYADLRSFMNGEEKQEYIVFREDIDSWRNKTKQDFEDLIKILALTEEKDAE